MRLNLFSRSGSDRRTILIVPNDGLDNIKSLDVLAEELRKRGNKVLFTVDTADNGLTTTQSAVRLQDTALNDSEVDYSIFKLRPIEVFENFTLKCLWKKFADNRNRDSYYQKLIERVKPDLILVESTLCVPAITSSGIPWIWINFGSPIRCLPDERLPPAWAGFTKKATPEEWSEFIERKNYLLLELRRQLNEWCASRGSPSLPEHSLHPTSPYLNVYVYPKDLDYTFGEDFPPKEWVGVSCLNKVLTDENNNSLREKLELPEELLSKPGRLIYLSMSDLGTADVDMMKRLTQLLAHSPNKFIVSKGKYANQYELPDNMWGDQCLPHTEAIRAADLVMTCGDSSTITEALFYGKPLIVLPLFGDQLDNAIRLKDCTFAVVLEPYKCQLSTTFASIVAMLDDPSVQRRLDFVSHKMQDTDELKNLCSSIEQIVAN